MKLVAVRLALAAAAASAALWNARVSPSPPPEPATDRGDPPPQQAATSLTERVEHPSVTDLMTDEQRVSPPDSIDAVTLALESLATLEVTLVDEGGQPVDAADLLLGPKDIWSFTFTAEVRGSSRAVFAPVRPGDYVLKVNSRDFRQEHVQIHLEPGNTTLELMLHPGSVVQGRVVDSSGRPVRRVAVEWRENESFTFIYAFTDATGAFQLRLRGPAAYRLHASDANVGSATVSVTAPASDVRIELHARASLELELVSEGQPVPDADVIIRLDDPNGDGTQEQEKEDGEHEADLSSNEAGAVVMRGLARGRYRITVSHPRLRWRSTFVRLAEGTTFKRMVAFAALGELHGRVVGEDGEPIASAVIGCEPILTPGDDGGDFASEVEVTKTNEGGEFRLVDAAISRP